MKKIVYIVSLLTLASCVRDEVPPCPPLQVSVTVKDKNYFNVDEVEAEERRSEGLAFRQYVPTLYYQLSDAATGQVVEEQGVFDVTGDEKTFPITFCDCIPHGTYVLTVWGGLQDNSPLTSDGKSIGFHPGNTAGNDVYMVHDTLVYDAYNYNYTADMERTKGKLVILMENLPAGINYSDKTVDNLYGNMNHRFEYSGNIQVNHPSEWADATQAVTGTVLSPSTEENASHLQAKLYDSPERTTPVLTPATVKITMKRNELTTLRYVYDDGKGSFNIYLLLNDAWSKINDMDIE